MNRNHLFLAMAALLAAGGLWFAGSAWRTHGIHKSSMGVDFKTPRGQKPTMGAGYETPHDPPKPGRILRPPEPNRRFTDFTPEQRVRFARQGHGPGG